MSSVIVWRPVSSENILSYEIKGPMRKRYVLPALLNHDDIAFLEGLDAAGIKGAKELIQAIVQHSTVQIEELF